MQKESNESSYSPIMVLKPGISWETYGENIGGRIWLCQVSMEVFMTSFSILLTVEDESLGSLWDNGVFLGVGLHYVSY